MTSEHHDFDEITVQRINVREPDGRLRCVISNSQRFPGLIMRGREYPHIRPQAGFLFFNDEETENGGLIFDGSAGSSGGSLTFDAYEQDQVVQLLGVTEPHSRVAGLVVTDRPTGRSLIESLGADDDESAAFPPQSDYHPKEAEPSGASGARRVFVGSQGGDAMLNLCDGNGVPRLRLRVGEDGESAIEFLNADGRVLGRFSPDMLAPSSPEQR